MCGPLKLRGRAKWPVPMVVELGPFASIGARRTALESTPSHPVAG